MKDKCLFLAVLCAAVAIVGIFCKSPVTILSASVIGVVFLMISAFGKTQPKKQAERR